VTSSLAKLLFDFTSNSFHLCIKHISNESSPMSNVARVALLDLAEGAMFLPWLAAILLLVLASTKAAAGLEAAHLKRRRSWR
jgi:hypothetical protein